MSSKKVLFTTPDESLKVDVQLEGDKKMKVEGIDTVALSAQDGKLKLLHGVQYVPRFAHNLFKCFFSVW